ncbi:steroidogenic acute regulatory protein, mitochondrial-like isoform X2 [Numida meleagris]|uniref:steroidogenic acute regulatory protein, mitochondrial-like isoform X2 n=1 Tax=Numida meleagris TaxID=8996 RepID=UPI000B3D85EA|nr:steroidogenic acute regulatory protein, mitochondrial-like isoform X2 [Numida meleagris]
MLQAIVKLCCGIAHDHLRKLPGLKTAATAVMQELGGSHCLPSEIPPCIQRLMGQDAARCTEPEADAFTHRPSSMDLSYIHQGERALQQALGILQQPHCWQPEAVLDTGAAVSSTTLPGLGRVFRAEAVLAVPAGWLQGELFERLEEMPRWNPSLSRVEVLCRPGKDTLVTHEVTAASPVGRRDFVSMRHRRRTRAAVYLVGTAAHLEQPPAPHGCIRAEMRLSCIMLQPLPGDPSCTRVTWLLSMDLKVSGTTGVSPCWPSTHHPSCISPPRAGSPPRSPTASCHSARLSSSGTSATTSLPPVPDPSTLLFIFGEVAVYFCVYIYMYIWIGLPLLCNHRANAGITVKHGQKPIFPFTAPSGAMKHDRSHFGRLRAYISQGLCLFIGKIKPLAKAT